MALSRAVPVLTVDDLPAAVERWRAVLGVEVLMDHGWIVTLGSPGTGAQLGLVTADATAPETPVASLQVEDVDAVHAAAVAQGLEIVHPLTDEPWGVRRFFLRDASGAVVNVLAHRTEPRAGSADAREAPRTTDDRGRRTAVATVGLPADPGPKDPVSTPETPTHQVLFLMTGADRWTLVDGSTHPTGFWADELVAPHRVFRDAGWEITIATPGGVTPPLDEGSLEPGAAGGDEAAADQRAYLDRIADELSAAVPVEDVDPRPFDVVYVPGGHGPMEDLAVHEPTGRLLTTMLDDDMKLVAAVCHGPAALLAARRADGSWPFAGRTLTAFTNEEEHQAGLGEIATWLLEDRLRDEGAAFEYGEPWASFVVEDRNLHTGQNPASAGPLAERLVEIVAARDEALKLLQED